MWFTRNYTKAKLSITISATISINTRPLQLGQRNIATVMQYILLTDYNSGTELVLGLGFFVLCLLL